MKKIVLVAVPLIFTIILFAACSKSDSTTGGGGTGGGGRTFSCAGITPKFAADVQPIIQSLCATNSSCHAGGSVNSGGSLTTYAEINAKKSNIRAQILSGAMPQTGTISQAQINALICWIDSGAPNN
ncbi:hypothetical protein [Ferruginibacter sp.]